MSKSHDCILEEELKALPESDLRYEDLATPETTPNQLDEPGEPGKGLVDSEYVVAWSSK